MPNLEQTIAATTRKLEQQLTRKAIADYAAKERQRKAARKAEADQRKADAHRKITLGGLVIAAGVDGWDEGQIVGALLAAAAQPPETLAKFKDRGITHLVEREAQRKARKG